MLSLRAVRKRYGHVVALDGVSLALNEGELFALLGPNGAGKSTLVRIAVGLARPDEGEVAIGSHGAPDRPEARRQLGVAPQELALYDNLSGEENLRFFADLQGLARAATARRIDIALEITGLGPRRRDRVGTYSGGMKRRLNVGVALLHDPPVLILDEPTAGVDPQARAALLDLCVDLRSAGKTILYTTHYLEEVGDRFDRVGILDHGRLLAVGGVSTLLAQHAGSPVLRGRVDGQPRELLVSDPTAALDALDGWRREGGVEAFELWRPGLPEVFLSLTGRSWRD